jgi:hypothetical protein
MLALEAALRGQRRPALKVPRLLASLRELE